MSFDRLIRFIDSAGLERYGNVESEVAGGDLVGKTVSLLQGNMTTGFSVMPDTKAQVTKVGPYVIVKHTSIALTELMQLLCPLESTPVILCAGVNYKSHASETKFTPPSKPVLFATPPDRLTGPFEDIQIHPDAQELLDYEGELAIVIGKDGYDIPEESALEYVLGYTVCNDVSARNLHHPDVSGWQMGYAKSFDNFGPTGPYLVSPRIVPNPQVLELTTKVNGQVRQKTNTEQMLWSCKQLIAFASRGRTLRQGTLIMTGTPEGVGWKTNGCLKDGDMVEVTVEKLGSISNRMVFQKP
jgi:2-keto-4-pentenoate hydratase/2-oxohepta-3-ene-1,7-dioic acid hydratase in catechol pathway